MPTAWEARHLELLQLRVYYYRINHRCGSNRRSDIVTRHTSPTSQPHVCIQLTAVTEPRAFLTPVFIDVVISRRTPQTGRGCSKDYKYKDKIIFGCSLVGERRIRSAADAGSTDSPVRQGIFLPAWTFSADSPTMYVRTYSSVCNRMHSHLCACEKRQALTAVLLSGNTKIQTRSRQRDGQSDNGIENCHMCSLPPEIQV